MIHWTGPSAHFSLTCSPAFGGSLNSWNATNIAGRPSDSLPAGGAAWLLRAAWKAAIAFFEYIEGSIDAPGWSSRNVEKSAFAFSAFPRLASQTPR